MEGFSTALGRIDFSAPTCEEVIDNGLRTISSIFTVGDEKLSDLVK